jgi:hypothetical protein
MGGKFAPQQRRNQTTHETRVLLDAIWLGLDRLI